MKKENFLPPAYLISYLLLAIGLHFVLPIKQLIYVPYKYSGILLIGFGFLLNIWADGLFKKKKTTINPFEKSSTLVLEGPFRFSRHPMYLGMVIILLGEAIILGSLIAFFIPVAFFTIMKIVFIPYEEKAMEETFGREYLDYKNRVRCWL
jgi:protein-S-isoprenylcysteine O-methyltransferase Ste14